MGTNQNFKKQFAKLLNSIHLPSGTSPQATQRVLSEIDNLLWSNIPQKLFRFRNCDTDNIISFQCGTIPVCVANAFKDRYDSLIFINKPWLDDTFQTLANNSTTFASGNLNSFYTDIERLFGEKTAEQIKQAYSQVPEKERAEMFHNGLQSFHDFTSMRIQDYREFIRKDRFTKLACFTEDITSLYMWDQYADGYRGFALEYDFRQFHSFGCTTCSQYTDCKQKQKVFPNVYPIIYSHERYDATNNIVNIILREALTHIDNTINALPPIDQLFWVKSYLYKDKKAYGHEKEWRIITHCPNQHDDDYATIPDYNCLKAIYYGPHMEQRHKEFLMNIAKNKGIVQYDVKIDVYAPHYSLRTIKLT